MSQGRSRWVRFWIGNASLLALMGLLSFGFVCQAGAAAPPQAVERSPFSPESQLAQERLTSGAAPSGAQAEGPSAQTLRTVRADQVIPNHYIVVLKDSVKHPGAVAADQAETVDGEVSLIYRSAIKGYAATLSRDDVEALEEDPRVDYVTPDRKVEALAQTTPTGIQRSGAAGNENLKIDGKDNLRVDVDVAVIDTGVDFEHPDLNVVMRTNCVPADQNEEVEECIDGAGADGYGHGTHVAGTIGAIDNGEGVVGVAPGARIWSVKVLNDGGFGSMSWIIAGVDWVTGHATQIEVANMSLGCKCSEPALDEAIEASAEAGVVYAIAAGNSHADTKDFSPAGNPDAITVSALADYDGKAGGKGTPTCASQGTDDNLASFSNFGAAVNVAAPGVCIYSTVPVGGSVLSSNPETKYANLSGTSMATPHVAGAAALLASEKNPANLTDVKAIRGTIEEKGNLEWTDNSGDGVKERLLDVSDKATFKAKDLVAVTKDFTVISSSEATLRGSVNPNGIETKYQIEYGETISYGSKAPASPALVGSGTEYVTVSQTVKSLKARTLYHYRVVATNAKGTFYGEDRTFGTTPPVVSVEAASEVEANDALLKGLVNPEGLQTSYRFEYGTTTAYGDSIPLSSEDIGSGISAVAVSQHAGGFTGAATYHFRLKATNVAGTAYSKDQTLTTPAAAWQEQSTPLAGTEPYERLEDVSCSTTTDCMSVGVEMNSSGRASGIFSQHWDGKEWSIVPMAESEDPLFYSEVIWGVSCTSPTWCVGVGHTEAGLHEIFDEVQPLVEIWDGSKWSIVPAPGSLGTEALGYWVYLLDVSCASRSSCVAVGWRRVEDEENPDLLEPSEPFVLSWDGEEWTLDESAYPPEAEAGASLDSVSCTGASSCLAVGDYWANGKFVGLSEIWDGEEWSILPVPPSELNPGENSLRNIACWGDNLPSTRCIAANFNSMWRWSGEEWLTMESPPAPTGMDWYLIFDLSCAGPMDCEMVGTASPGSRAVPMAAHWSGGDKWSLQSVSDPAQTEEPVGYWGIFEGVSCLPGHCTAAGFRQTAGLEEEPLAEDYPHGPIVATEPPAAIKMEEATLKGKVNPQGSSTSYQFEYVSAEDFDADGYAKASRSPLTPKAIGSGSSDIEVSEVVTGLKPGTTYHVRVAAIGSAGTFYGGDRQFSTAQIVTPTFSSAFGSSGSGNGQFKSPNSVAVDASGNLWVADFNNNRVEKFNTKSEYLSQFGTTGSGNGQFSNPSGIAIDASGNLWVVDRGNRRVQKFNSKGEYLSQFGSAGSGNGQLNLPWGIAIDASGNIWIADTKNHRVQAFNPKGEYLTKFGSNGSGNGQFSFPQGIAIDSSGNVWVTDTGNNRVQTFNSKDEYLSQFGSWGSGNGQFISPNNVSIDSLGNLWVTDSGNDRVQAFNPKGEYLAKFGSTGSGNGQFSSPGGIAIDSGRFWVVDGGNNRVEMWAQPLPTFSFAFGSLGSGNGQLNNPKGIAIDTAGNLWVADYLNNRVQKFNSKGEYLSQFGSAGSGNGQFSNPRGGIAIDASGNLWVIDTSNNRVQKFNSKGEYLSQFGSSGSGNGQFNKPIDVAIDSGGNLWVLQQANPRVQKFNSKGEYLSQFGSAGSANGQFSNPSGVAIDASGNLWVADSGNNRVQKFNSNGEYLSKFGSLGSGNGQLNGPSGIAIDAAGHLWITDTNNNRVQALNGSGEYLGKFGVEGSGSGQLKSPFDLAIDSGGDIWVTDSGNNRVEKWVP